MEVKSKIFLEEHCTTRMFWFITDKVAFGGKDIPSLLFFILKRKRDKSCPNDEQLTFGTDCKRTEVFFMRIKNLFSKGYKITLK